MLGLRDQPKIELYNTCRRLNDRYVGLIVILVGKQANELEAVFDKSKHDVRTEEPFFYKEDNIEWKII